MSTNHTTNYNLNQWEATDKVLRAEFNEDNAKIDAALKSNADAIGTLEGQMEAVQAGKGNCKIVYGTYAGTGTADVSGATTLTFSAPPLFVAVMPAGTTDNMDAMYRLLLIRGAAHGFTTTATYEGTVTVTWSGNSVSWYNYGVPAYQCNDSNQQYCYIALIDMAE